MDKRLIIKKTAGHARKALSGESSGHDWRHTWRVLRLARRIAKEEKADAFVVELAALLHDIDDWKFSPDSEAGARSARTFLESLGVEETAIAHVCCIIRDIPFKGAKTKTARLSLEGKVVQDADRLDALGAIGIARAFAYGGMKGRALYEPGARPKMHKTARSYLGSKGTTINHFREKLLLLKGRMSTKAGKRIAKKRHAYMERYLGRFMSEWAGKE